MPDNHATVLNCYISAISHNVFKKMILLKWLLFTLMHRFRKWFLENFGKLNNTLQKVKKASKKGLIWVHYGHHAVCAHDLCP
jgi:hypothetical protein